MGFEGIGHRPGESDIRQRLGVRVDEFAAIVDDDGAESEPVGEVDDGTTDVAGADDEDGVSCHVGLKVDGHRAAAYPEIALRGVAQVVGPGLR